ncbi:hypothetical protein C3405_21915 [Aeromonas hydrophila]|nr:hypothetical protein C2U40_01815 [Aeromonas sp. ASNIH4]POU32155.1 hypothetical protein C3405_21915 [Aeromonas hydrophila]POV85702.1 hypothetical protein C3395_22665 [Aeromonas sp. ASNIH6]
MADNLSAEAKYIPPALGLSTHQFISSSVHQFISSSVHQFISSSVHQFIVTPRHDGPEMTNKMTTVTRSVPSPSGRGPG